MNSRSQTSAPSARTIEANKWLVACTAMFGAFMSVMDFSIVNVAMPHMMGSFSEDMYSITWVATSYSIAELIMVTMTGWWSAVLGRKRLYLLSFALFTLGSALCGTAVSFHQMLFYRVIQGVGGGALIPVSQAILRESFPQEEQGMAMAIFGMGVVLAPAIGPVVSGWLTDHYGWPWIFFVNIPVSIIGMFMVGAFVHDPSYLRRGIKKIDWVGIALLAVVLVTLQVVLDRGEQENWFDSRMITIEAVTFFAALVCLIFWERKMQEPVVNFRILHNASLSLGSIIVVVFGVVQYGTTFILPQFAQNLLGYPAFQSGLMLAPRAVTLMLFMPVVGWLYNRVSARILVLTGVGVMLWAYYDLAHLSLEAGFWNLVPMLLLMGAGMPFVFVTLSTVSLSTLPRSDMTDAASIYTLARRVGGNIGYAIAATLLDRGQQIHRAYLADHVNLFNPALAGYGRAVSSALAAQLGFSQQTLRHAVYSLADRAVNMQSSMMAYNDVSMTFGILFLCVTPLIMLLPGRAALPGRPAGPPMAED